MPTFDTVPIDEARANTVTGQRAALLQEYVGYIQGVPPGQAGKLAARRGRDDPGNPAQAQRGGGDVGREPRGPAHRRRRLLLDVGGPRPRQAPQEPGRLTNAEHPDENSRIRNASDRGFGNAAEVSLLRWPNGPSQEQEGEQRLLGLSEVPRL